MKQKPSPAKKARSSKDTVDRAESAGPNMDQHTLSHCVSAEIEYEYNLDLAPRNQKMILLTIGGTSIQGSFTGDEKRDSDIMGFYPLPKRNKVKEDQLKKEGRFPWTKLGVI